MMTNTDLSRLLKSEEIQQAIRAPKYVFLLALLSDRFRLPNTFAVPSSTMCCGILPGRRRWERCWRRTHWRTSERCYASTRTRPCRKGTPSSTRRSAGASARRYAISAEGWVCLHATDTASASAGGRTTRMLWKKEETLGSGFVISFLFESCFKRKERRFVSQNIHPRMPRWFEIFRTNFSRER